jgi:U3 small nucleolar RNA-associated protein 19
MPSTTSVSKKRKLPSSDSKAVKKASKKSRALTTTTTQESILELEQGIVESPKHYNNIVTLLGHLRDDVEIAVTAGVALCRTFCRLMAKGRLVKRKEDSEEEGLVVAWLKERYREFVAELCRCLDHEEQGVQVCPPPLPHMGELGADGRRIRR